MKEKNKSKTLKGQLFGAVSMMLVAAIALGTSTYAWFINNSTVAVETMDLTVSASTSLQIAVLQKESTTYTAYKNLITKADITGDKTAGGGGWTDMFNTTTGKLVPASTVDTALALVGAGDPKFFMSDNHIGAKSQKLDSFEAVTTLGEGGVKRIPLSFLASTDLKVYFGQSGTVAFGNLVTPSHVKTQAEITAMGDATAKAAAQAIFDAETKQAEAIRAALHISVVPHDKTTVYPAPIAPLSFQFDIGGDAFTSGTGNNTDYSYITPVYTPVAKESEGKFDGISAVTPDTQSKDDTTTKISAITGAGVHQTKAPGYTSGDANSYVAVVTVNNNTPTVDASGKTELFTLKANEPRDVDVIIWLEGTDKDCISALSGYKFNLDLPFAAAAPTP